MGPHAWWDYPGLSWISQDTQYHGVPCMTGLPGTVLGIPRYLVSWDPWDSMPGGSTRDCPGYPRILSISGSRGLHAQWDYTGLSWVPQDTQYHGDNLGPPGYVILGCPMYPGMSRVVPGQAVAVLDIPHHACGTESNMCMHAWLGYISVACGTIMQELVGYYRIL